MLGHLESAPAIPLEYRVVQRSPGRNVTVASKTFDTLDEVSRYIQAVRAGPGVRRGGTIEVQRRPSLPWEVVGHNGKMDGLALTATGRSK